MDSIDQTSHPIWRDYDTSEVYLKHGDLVIAKLDSMRALFSKDSPLQEIIVSKGIGQFLQTVEQSMGSKNVPKLSDSYARLLKDYQVQILNAALAIDYAVTYVKGVKEHLIVLESRSAELDLRWNNVFTIHILKLFNIVSKICMFFYFYPGMKNIVLLKACWDKIKKEETMTPLGVSLMLIKATSNSPYDAIRMLTDCYQRKFNQIITQVGPILIKIFGIWTGINWQEFSIFNRPERAVESTLPPTESILLSYLELIHTFCYFFFLTFPDIFTNFPQFQALVVAVFSDSPNMFITRSLMIPFEQFIKASEKAQNKLTGIDFSFVLSDIEVKKSSTHKQRVFYIQSLIRDISDVSTFDPKVLPNLSYDILPLAGFANYELRCMLQFVDIKYPEAAQLLAILVDLAHIVNKYQKTIGRFMLFNLGTVDSNYMNEMINTFTSAPSAWQTSLNNSIVDISQQLQTLDLEEYDRNERYDIIPLIHTCGRIMYYFNYIKTQQRAAFLNPMFEHFNVIILHSNLMQRPLDTFLHFCPIQTYWSYAFSLGEYARENIGGAQLYSRFISLFAYFNRDAVSLYSVPARVEDMSQVLVQFRNDILGNIMATIKSYLSPGSKLVEIINQNRFAHMFNWERYVDFKMNTDVETDPVLGSIVVQSDSDFRAPIWALKEFMMKAPGVVDFAGQECGFSEFMASEITRNLTQILFQDCVADPQWVDQTFAAATQFVWPLYSLLGKSFARKLTECRFENSTYNNQITFLEQISLIRQDVDAINNAYSQKQIEQEQDNSFKLVTLFEERIVQFIRNDYQYTIYRPYGKCFSNLPNTEDKISYNAEQFFSKDSFMFLFHNLGPQSGFSLERKLIVEIVILMTKLYEGFEKNNGQIINLYQDYKKDGKKWAEEEIRKMLEPYSVLLIRLGVVLTVRKLIRDALKEVATMTVPGIASCISAALGRSPERLTQKEDLINELVGEGPNYHFLELALSQKTIRQTSDPFLFVFFLALLLNGQASDTIRFIPENEVMTGNYHLVPIAIDAFMQMFKIFSQSSDSATIQSCISYYFSVMSHIVQLKRKTAGDDQVNALLILADLFPKYLTHIEYGRIGENFPFSVVSEAYKMVDSTSRSKRQKKLEKLESRKGSIASMPESSPEQEKKDSKHDSKKGKKDKKDKKKSKK